MARSLPQQCTRFEEHTGKDTWRKLFVMLTLPLVVLFAQQMVNDQQNWRKSSILHSSLKTESGVVLLFIESWKQSLLHRSVLLYNSFSLLIAMLVYTIWLLQVNLFYFRYIFISGITSFCQLNLKINLKH